MIQILNSVSLSSGTANNQVLSSGLSGETTNSETFTANFLDQLLDIQINPGTDSGVNKDLLSSLAASVEQPDLKFSEQDLQNFAALLTKNNNVTAKNVGQDINLNDTFTTLTNVLQYLQGLKGAGNIPNQLAANSQPDDAGSQLTDNLLSTSLDNQVTQAVNANSLTKNKTNDAKPSALTEALAATAQLIQQLQLPIATPVSAAEQNTSAIAIPTQTVSADQINQQNQLADKLAIGNALNVTQQKLPASANAQTQTNPPPPPPPSPVTTSASDSMHAAISSALAAMDGSLVFTAKPLAMPTKANNVVNNQNQLPANQDVSPASASKNDNTNPIGALQTASMPQNSAATQPSNGSNFADIIQAEHGQKDAQVTKVSDPVPVNIAQFNQPANLAKANDLPAMTLPINHPDWNAELAGKLQLMHTKEMPNAELQLNPAHLGPITIKIGMEHDQTTVTFTTQHAEVKQAIEASIPKLREMFGDQQLNLLNVNVSQQQSEQKSAQSFFQMGSEQGKGNQSDANNQAENSTNSASIDKVANVDASTVINSDGLLNLFA